jgi:uncharacterized protein DUF6259
MTKKNAEFAEIGVLRLNGDICIGELNSIINMETGECFIADESRDLLLFEIEVGEESSILHVEEFEFDSSTGWLIHPLKNIEILIEWSEAEKDTAVCRVRFKYNSTNLIVRKVIFALSGRFDPQIESDKEFLVYPKAGGMRIPDPRRELLVEKKNDVAKWNDRELGVWREGLADSAEATENSIDFNPSMNWLDYYCSRSGLYLASHDPYFEKTKMIVETKKNDSNLSFRVEKSFNRTITEGTIDFAIGVHQGDWHRGAEIYRRFFDSTNRKIKSLPEFMRDSPGVMCHYDFKWQNGVVTHHFRDIPELHTQSLADGFNELVIAGWNVNGFDNSYPEFRPDPDLGSEEELISAVKTVKKGGGKLFFYVNAYSFDDSSPDFKEQGAKWAVKTKEGKIVGGQWGQHFLGSMCNSCAGWRNRVKDNIRYVIDVLGADGVYIDQLNGTPQNCYDSTHNHDMAWKLNNHRLMTEVREELGEKYAGKIFLFSEWLSDVMATELDAQLIHTCWGSGLKYAFPEMFKYTFPESALFDQVLQKPWGGNPEDVEGDHAKEVVCRMFVNDILFWCYDHVPNTPEVGEFLKKTVELRRRVSKYLESGGFVDDVPVVEINGDAVVKSYESRNGDYCFLIWNKAMKPGSFKLKKNIDKRKIRICDFDGDRSIKANESFRTIQFTKAELQVVVISD